MTRAAQRRYDAAASLAEQLADGVLLDEDCPLRCLAQAFFRQVTAEADVDRAARAAYEAGHSWTTIGAMLGITKQAARKRFGSVPE